MYIQSCRLANSDVCMCVISYIIVWPARPIPAFPLSYFTMLRFMVEPQHSKIGEGEWV